MVACGVGLLLNSLIFSRKILCVFSFTFAVFTIPRALPQEGPVFDITV